MADPHMLIDPEYAKLEESINDFLTWVRTKCPTLPASGNVRVRFCEASDGDWIMRVQDDGEVQFNPAIAQRCSPGYFRMVVLHECFHLFVQAVPNKVDAKRLRDDFGSPMMNLFDIEADYYAALYLKERYSADVFEILRLTYEGSRIFGDPKIRNVKVERFLGSILSIANAFLSPAENSDTLYLPNISNLATDGSVHVIMFRQSHLAVGEINASLNDFVQLRDCYTRGGELYTVQGYARILLEFACKALSLPRPADASERLAELRV